MTIDAAVNEIERANSGAGVSETFKFSTDGIQQMIPVSGEQVSSTIISPVTEAVIKQAPALAQTSHSNSPYAMQAGRDMTINNVPVKRGTAIYPSVTPSTHVQEPSGGDSESALAVKALLQTQDSQDDLPGLTAPYSQDSPPPTLTLVSRTGPTEIQNHVETSQSFSAGYPQPTSSVYPVTSAHPRLVPSSSPTRESLQNHFSVAMTNTIQNRHLSTQVATSSPTIFNTHTLNPPQNSTKIVPEDSTSGTTQHSGVHPGLKEHFLSVVPPSYSTYPANKMAKGKTVPIPVDPNHGLMISPTHFARATSPGSQSG
uniref:Uncharacterized protein n=1 Tax=Ciona savignyi TaxID=51511 RepID=H2YT06_CIOSA